MIDPNQPFEIRTAADVQAFESISWPQRKPAQSTYELVCQASERHPDRAALRFIMTGNPGDKVFTFDYRTLKERVTQAANAFHQAGIVPGKAVTLLLPNFPQTHFALLGAQAAGIASPVNPMLDVEHIASIVNETCAEAMVTLGPLPGVDIWEKAVEVVDRCPSIRTLYVVNAAQYLGTLKAGVVRTMAMMAKRPQRNTVTVLDFDATLQRQPAGDLLSRRRFAESDLCAYFHTGGTTGLPKIAVHRHANEVYVASMLCAMEPRPGVVMCGLPLFHVNGAMVTGLAAFHGGSEVVMLTPSGYRGENVMANFWQLIERFRATSFSGVPTIYANLAALPRNGADISSVRYAACGAAPLPGEVARRFESATGIRLTEGYGLTEGACVTTLNPPLGESRAGTVGIRLPYQQVKAWKVDSTGNAVAECVPGEAGVIGICGPNVFPGYLRNDDNKGIWLAPGWLNTGDLGFLDGSGYLHLTGRAKELIIRGGHNIDPAMIEDALLRHPAVAMVAAVGQPDAHAGELPMAFVTLKPGATATAEEIAAAARDLVPERAAVPVRVEILQQMALTTIGKVAKAVLRMRAAEHVLREQLASNAIPAQVHVRSDLQRGSVAVVTCPPAHTEKALQLLGRFAIPVELAV
jgi:fatty-acyl-CoA synthase